jgi:RNA polymerase sigma-70 factor (ECF subfamily)
LRLWRRLDGAGAGVPPRSIAAWLRKAAVSSALDVARRRERRERMLDPAARSAQPIEAAADNPGRGPAAQAQGRELDTRLAAALRELPEGQRTIFLLRHEGGLPLREVAEALGVETTTVKTQFARACLKLQSRLRWLQDDETRP